MEKGRKPIKVEKAEGGGETHWFESSLPKTISTETEEGLKEGSQDAETINPFEARFIENVSAASTATKVVEVVKGFYEAGGAVTDSAGNQYEIDHIVGLLQDESSALNEITSRYGLREKIRELRESKSKEGAYREALPIVDTWITENLHAESRMNLLDRITEVKRHCEESAKTDGQDYSFYVSRLDEWLVEAERLQQQEKGGGNMFSTIPSLQEIFFGLK